MMKKTLLALAASLAFVGVAQAQAYSATDDEFEVEVHAFVEAYCMMQPQSVAEIENEYASISQSASVTINCNLDLPYSLNLANPGGIINLEGDKGTVMAVVTEGAYNNPQHLDGTVATAVDGVGTGVWEEVEDLWYWVNPDIPANPNGNVIPEEGTYQGFAHWVLSF